MPPAKKRKTAAAAARRSTGGELPEASTPKFAKPSPDADADASRSSGGDAIQLPTTVSETPALASEPSAAASAAVAEADAATLPQAAAPSTTTTTTTADRLSRFRALQARAKSSSTSNLKAATTEAQRLSSDPSQLTAINRKHAIASHKLLKQDVEDSGEDFERKRAWDWTVDESEAWDKRQAKKSAHRDDSAFQDYRRESQKVYKRQLKALGDPDLEAYAKEKMKAVEKAAAQGTLEIVETEDGELLAVDTDGTFYATANSTGFVNHKPDKAAVDKLVSQMNKADEAAMRKRKERAARNGEDADVTYINDKNKVFNQRLSRFYNKYTKDIRDSFERGTMI